jgi:hypothetical protein
VDVWVPQYVNLAVQRLAKPTVSRKLADALMCVVAGACYYAPRLALAALEAAGGTQRFFSGWFTAIMAKKPNGKPKHFKRLQDKKARMFATYVVNPRDLEGCLPALVTCLLQGS